jgi:hypothetical protein
MSLVQNPEPTLDRWTQRAFAFGVILLAWAIASVLGLSALGWQCTRPRLLALLLAVVGLAVVVAWKLPSPRLEYRRDARVVWWLAALSLVAWVVQFVRVFHLVLERPVYDWDGLYYHLPAIHGWVQAGRIHWLSGLADIPFANGYSMGAETLGFAVATLTGHGRFVDGSTLFFWPVGLFAVVVFARQVGASPAWSWFAGGCTAQIPSLVALSTTLYVDAAFGIAAWCAVAASVRWFGLQSRSTAWDALLLGSAMGLAATTKGMGWVLGAVLGVFLLWLWFRSRVSAPRAILQVTIVFAAVFAVAGYWPLRNTLHTSNPIHPLELRIGEKLLDEGYSPRLMVQQDLPEGWRKWPPPLRPLKSWISFDAPRHGHNAVGGLGILWLALGLPAWVWLSLRRTPSTWPRWLGVFALTLLVLQPGAWWSRFTLWLPGLGLVAAALAFSILAGRRWGRVWVAVAALVFVGAVFESAAALRWEERQGRDPNSDAYVSSFDYYFPHFTDRDFAAAFLVAPRIARSPWSRMGTLFGGALCHPLSTREIFATGSAPDSTDIERLRHDGVSWIVWDVIENGEASPALEAAAADTFRYRVGPSTDFQFLRLD